MAKAPDYQAEIAHYQEQLLEQARQQATRDGHPLSAAVEAAFIATPRHRFVQQYRYGNANEWRQVTPQTLADDLPILYSNHALGLWGAADNTPSTISQPSLVLYMLELLQLAPGQRVFEVGAGSGWNAAMLGRLVAPDGVVYSVEIIPEMARQAAHNVAALGLNNVTILHGDGGDCYAAGGPYDRAIFTAGAADLPRCFHEELAPGALLLFVHRQAEVGDSLFLLRKADDHFRSLESLSVGFVPMVGAHAIDSQPQRLTDLPAWAELQQQIVEQHPFWWGGRGEASLLWRTRGIRSFLSIVEPWFRTFYLDEDHGEPLETFGLWDAESRSLTLAVRDQLVTYGNLATHDRLRTWLRRWIDLGMPAADSFDLAIYPADATVTPGHNEWLTQRAESQFLWRLPASG
jgi:protein-L-isoaspartate(D-aspartate) O-methyltransferase